MSRLMTRKTVALATLLAAAPILFVAVEAVRTLQALTIVERERDTWQRPDAVIEQLALRPGDTVVDLGAGAGYFALRLAPRVAPNGRVLAIDLRRQSLAFLWIRARLGRQSTISVIHGEPTNPRLPDGPVDAVLMANTYHELSARGPILETLFRAMRPGAMLVVVDHQLRSVGTTDPGHGHHDIAVSDAEREITSHSFHPISRRPCAK